MSIIDANVHEDAPQTMGHSEIGLDPRQLENTYVLEEKTIDSSYIIGSKPGVSSVKNVSRQKKLI